VATPHQPAESSVEFLRTRTVFSTLSPQLFQLVAAELEWIGFDQDEVLLSQGDQSDRFYFVVHGRLAITRRDAGNRERLIGWVRPGEAVGELALLEGETRTATVRASRATVAATLRRESYEALAVRAPSCLVLLNRLLAARLRQAIDPGTDRRTTAEILTVVAASRDAPLGELCTRLCRVLEKEGPVLHLSAERLQAMVSEDAESAALDVERRGRLLTWLNGL